MQRRAPGGTAPPRALGLGLRPRAPHHYCCPAPPLTPDNDAMRPRRARDGRLLPASEARHPSLVRGQPSPGQPGRRARARAASPSFAPARAVFLAAPKLSMRRPRGPAGGTHAGGGPAPPAAAKGAPAPGSTPHVSAAATARRRARPPRARCREHCQRRRGPPLQSGDEGGPAPTQLGRHRPPLPSHAFSCPPYTKVDPQLCTCSCPPPAWAGGRAPAPEPPPSRARTCQVRARRAAGAGCAAPRPLSPAGGPLFGAGSVGGSQIPASAPPAARTSARAVAPLLGAARTRPGPGLHRRPAAPRTRRQHAALPCAAAGARCGGGARPWPRRPGPPFHAITEAGLYACAPRVKRTR
jgi:hypothetical protein